MNFFVRQTLQDIGRFLDSWLIVVEHVVMCRSRGSLDAGVRTKIKIKFSWMSDCTVHNGSSRNVLAFSVGVSLILTEKAGMVTFLTDYNSHFGTIRGVQRLTGHSNLSELGFDDLLELAFGNAVSVVDDVERFLVG